MHNKLIESMKSVIVGKEAVLERILTALLAEGHVLIEDVPGVGKTTAAKALAKSMDLSFSRIQFTPDLLPSDILGVSVYRRDTYAFEFRKGPVFSQIVLADEINRASPKTQSSLLEVMEEHQVTMDGKTFAFQGPFMVVATQNPIEYEGTFPLPEAQLDRFLMKIKIGYPGRKDEMNIVGRMGTRSDIGKLEAVATEAEVMEMQAQVRQVHADESIGAYIVDIVRKTRESDEVLLGCSPRAAVGLLAAAKAHAYIHNRRYVLPEDVKSLASDVLAHRIIIKPEVSYTGRRGRDIVEDILSITGVPKVTGYEE